MKMHAVILSLVLAAGCTGPPPATEHSPSGSRATAVDTIQVEGYTAVRGHMPFTRIVLETDDHNFYILDVEDEAENRLRADLPGRYRVLGVLSLGDWDGRPYAHLRPTEIERL